MTAEGIFLLDSSESGTRNRVGQGIELFLAVAQARGDFHRAGRQIERVAGNVGCQHLLRKLLRRRNARRYEVYGGLARNTDHVQGYTAVRRVGAGRITAGIDYDLHGLVEIGLVDHTSVEVVLVHRVGESGVPGEITVP